MRGGGEQCITNTYWLCAVPECSLDIKGQNRATKRRYGEESERKGLQGV